MTPCYFASIAPRLRVRTLLVIAFAAALLGTGTPHRAHAQATCTTEEGQRTCVVEPGAEVFLNEIIDADTTETGARVDSTTIYELKRGGIYILSGSIEHRGYPLTIVAEEGDGPRPRIIPGVVTGGEAARAFTPRGDLTLRGLYVTNQDELGGLVLRIIRVRENDARIILDDVHLDRASQSAFRIDGTNTKIYIYNSIISNIGTPDSPENGRGIDDRGNDIDSIVVRNTTFYNITSRALRDDGGLINYAEFTHNTFVNVGRHVVSFGPAVEAYFTNNLLINTGFYGNMPYEAEEDEVRHLIELDSLPENPDDQQVVIRNNNIYRDPAIEATYPDTVSVVETFDAAAAAYVEEASAAGTMLEEAIAFTAAPEVPTAILTTYYANPGGAQESWDTGVSDDDILDPSASVMPFDFAYPTEAASYTASTAGQPLGALTWFGLDIMPTAVEPPSEVPAAFQIDGNYPNPFNPVTTLQFDLPTTAEVTVEVFDLLGRRVLMLPPRQMQAGSARTVRVDASTLASGVYLYRVQAVTATATLVDTGRMVLLK